MFGNTGLGTFPFTSAFSKVEKDKAIEILDAYFGSGGRYLDVAPTYAFGETERLIGEYLANKPRESFIISTSCGYVRDGDGFRISGKREDIFLDLEESLDRLGLDYFDIYISHIPDLNTPFEETSRALQEILESSVAKQIGVSNVDEEQLLEYSKSANITIVQNRLSYVNRTVSSSMQDLLAKIGAKIVAYQVIERGLLSARGPSITAESDLRRRKPEFEQGRIDWLRNFVESSLMQIANRAGMEVEELVIRWVVSQPYVGLAQIGATNPIEASKIPTYNEPLQPFILNELEQSYTELIDELRIMGFDSPRKYLGLESYDVRSGSASGN